jgi:hypothetical protein
VSEEKTCAREFDLESVYDDQIAPRIREIIAICTKHGLPMFANFQLTSGHEADGAPMYCTTRIPADGEDQEKFDALQAIAEPRTPFVAVTVVHTTKEPVK